MNRPFDEAKYSALLKGLEVSEILFSELERTLRLDAEYFRKWYLHCANRVLNHASSEKVQSIGGENGVAEISDGNHFSISDYFQDEGVPYYRGQDAVGHFFIEQATPVCIPENIFNEQHLHRSHLKQGDVLLSIVGTIGEASLVTSDSEATCSCKLAILRPRNIAPEYLATYIRCAFGQAEIQRFTRGAVQMGLLLEDLDQISIARFSTGFEKRIAEQVQEAQRELHNNSDLYTQAESTLLRALNLENWNPPRMSTYEVRAGEAFRKGRLDAEHFHPQYDALLQHLQTHAKRCRLVQEFSSYCDRGVQPEYSEDGKYPVVNSRHILERGLDYDNFERTEETFWNSPQTQSARIARGDVLTYTTGAKIGRTAVYLEDEPALASNHVNLLRVRDENSIYVAVALNSFIGRMQTRQNYTGSAQVEIYPNDIQNFLVPFVGASTQAQIVADVEASHIARRRAKGLLEAAKRAVEIAIEENEAAGLEYLNKATNSSKAIK